MRGFHKSLKASQEKMGAALNAAAASASDSINSQLPPGYRLRGASVANASSHGPYGDRVPVSRPGPGAGTPHLRRGDDGVAERDTSSSASSTRTGSATGPPSSPSAWCRSWRSPRRRAHPVASAGDGGEKVGSRITWRATRDLRCAPRPGDVLVLEVYAGRDVTERSNAWERCGSSAVLAQRRRGGRIDATDAAQAFGARPRHRRIERRRRGSHHPAQGAAHRRGGRGRFDGGPRSPPSAKTVFSCDRGGRVERSHAEHEPDEDDEVRPPAERGGVAVPEAAANGAHAISGHGGGWSRGGGVGAAGEGGPVEATGAEVTFVRLFADSRRRRLRR